MFLFSPVSLNCSKKLFSWQHGNARKCLLHKRHLSQIPHEWQSVDCDTGLLPSVNWWHRLRGNIFNKLLNNFHKVLFIIVRIICWKRITIPQGRRVANIWDALNLRCGARGNALCSDWYVCPQIPHSYIQPQIPTRPICTNINIVYCLKNSKCQE